MCVKAMQGLGRRSRTDIALSMLDVLPLKCIIDQRKLIFLGQLCRLHCINAIRRVFLFRLSYSKLYPTVMLGFFPDIWEILRDYDLTHYLLEFIHKGIFPKNIHGNVLLTLVYCPKQSVI